MHLSSQPANGEGVPDLNSHQAEPVYANSHAQMFADPSSAETSPATMKALHEHGLLTALIAAFTEPTPHGVDGESNEDVDFEENTVRSLWHLLNIQVYEVLFNAIFVFFVIDCYTLTHPSAMANSLRRRNSGCAFFSTNGSE